MEAKLDNITIAESLPENGLTNGENEETVLDYVKENTKKIELNVNAKEFVPRLSSDTPPPSEPGDNDVESASTCKPSLNCKNGDENYKPIFMNGMTEKFIQGPYMGNGRDPEIPYIRYFSKGQTLDFFNKKYFSNGNSGEIAFKPYEANEEPRDTYLGPMYANGFSDNNIFKPPFISALVSDILQRQHLSQMWSKNPLFGPPRRGVGKGQSNSSYISGNSRIFTRGDSARASKSFDKDFPKMQSTTNGLHEEWYPEECTLNGYGEEGNFPRVKSSDSSPEICVNLSGTEKLGSHYDKCKSNVLRRPIKIVSPYSSDNISNDEGLVKDDPKDENNAIKIEMPNTLLENEVGDILDNEIEKDETNQSEKQLPVKCITENGKLYCKKTEKEDHLDISNERKDSLGTEFADGIVETSTSTPEKEEQKTQKLSVSDLAKAFEESLNIRDKHDEENEPNNINTKEDIVIP